MAGRPSQTRRVVVALDGPASSGKSSVGSAAAAQLGLRFVDTGLFYRAVTALALLENVPVDDAAALVPLVDRVELADDGTGCLNRVLLDGMDATEEARGATVDSFVSTVARQPEVREALLGRQRMLAEAGGIVVAGRDIGTVVLPDADLKLYLDASVEARADRRIQERGLDPGSEEAEEVREQLAIRDAIDTGREVAPLRVADDAVHLDTDGNAFEDSVEIVAAEIARVMLTPRKRTRSKPSSSASRTAAAAAAAAEALGTPVTEAVDAAPEPEPELPPGSEPGPEIPPEPETGLVPAPPAPVDPGPFAVEVAAAAVIAHPVLGAFAVAPDVAYEPYQLPQPEPEPVPVPEPVDPGPFAVEVPVGQGIGHPDLGAFAVAADVPFEPYQLPQPDPGPVPEPVDPGPFAVDVRVGQGIAHADLGAFAVAADVPFEPYRLAEPEPAPAREPVDPGPFAVDVRVGQGIAHADLGAFAVAADVPFEPYRLPEPEPIPAPVPVHPGPFSIDAAVAAGIAHPDLGAFAVAADVPFEPYRLPEPELIPAPVPVDPGPFAVSARVADAIAHVDLGAFAVAADVPFEPYRLPEPHPVSPAPIDPGPFAVGATTADVLAHADLGAFAVAADVPFEPYQLPEPATIAAPEPIDPGPFAVGATTADVLAHADLGAFAVAADVAYEPFTLPEPAELEPESELESPSEPEPEHEAPEDASPEPVAAAVPSAPPSGPRPVTPVAHSRKPTVLETAMRLDNKQTTLVRYVGLVARVGSRLFADVQVEGLEHIPRTGPVILACNHISNADPVVLGAWITQALRRRRIHWLGKKELFDWPVVGRMAASGGVHPVDRDAADVEAFRLASRILEKGYVLLVFPEGTRSPTGELQEAKDGVALLAIRTGAQVVPIGVSNTDAVWQKGQPLPMPFPRRRVTVRIGTPFRVQDVIPEGTDRRAAKGLATRAIMGRIAALLDPRHRGVYADAIREASRPEG